MTREKRLRADGTEIDPVKDLAEFVQSHPMDVPESEGTASPVIATEPSDWRKVTLADADDDELKGKTAEDAVRIAKDRRDALVVSRRETEAARQQLQQQQIVSQAEAAARRIFEENKPKPTPEEPKEDPRWAQVDELHMSGDYAQSGAIRRQLVQEEAERIAEVRAVKLKQEITEDYDKRERNRQGHQASETAMQWLYSQGVKPEHVTPDRVTAVMAVITRPSRSDVRNPYYDNRGPLNWQVIAGAWRDLFPYTLQQQQSTAIPAPAAPVVVAQPSAPPGSNKPAPAAQPGKTKEVHLSADEKRDLEHIAQQFGYDKEKFVARNKARRAAAEDVHA